MNIYYIPERANCQSKRFSVLRICRKLFRYILPAIAFRPLSARFLPCFGAKNRESPQCGSFPLHLNSYHAVFAFEQF